MSALSIQPTFPIFTETDGLPLENGYIWIGAANLDPQGNPINVYWDAALTIQAAQPIRTLNGYPSRSGTPARIYVNSDYSIRVQNSKGSLVYSAPEATERYGNIINATDIAYDPPFTSAVQTSVALKLSEWVSVKDFGAVGNGVANDTTAFLNAFATGKAVYAPAGTYLTDIQTMPSNSYLFGDGASTIIKPLTPDVRSALGTLPAANQFISNVTLRDIKLLGAVAGSGFSEQKHLAAFNGVRNLLVERCIFEGFRGDGLYIGTGNGDGLERHNENVIVKDCVFDGVNNDNRQGISIIDIDGMLIEGNRFQNCTRANMPGAIDFEPDTETYRIVRNVSVVNNNFYNVGGNVGVIAFFFVTPETWVNAPCNFVVDGNTFENCDNTPLFAGLSIVTGTADDLEDQNFVFSNNLARNCSRWAVQFFDTKNLKLVNNTFYKITNQARLAGGTSTNIDMLVSGNSFIECGYSTGTGFSVFNAQRLTIENNLFKDCGAGAGAAALAFDTGTSSYVSIINNVITSPQTITQIAIQKEAGHTFTPSTNQFFGNTLTVSGNFFQSTYNDTLETTYTPVVSGATTEGVGTYTNREGRWRRLGNQVFFRTEVTCSSHTGSGLMQISLPTSTAAAPSGLWTAVSLVATGVASTGGHIGLINPDPLVGGFDVVRAYQSTTGTLAQIVIPAGAFTVYVAGVYSIQ
jgi:hypothetical protein